MDRDWLKYKLTLGLEYAERHGIERDDLPDFLAQDIANNYEQIQRAKVPEYTMDEVRKLIDELNGVTRDTPEYYDHDCIGSGCECQ